MRHPGLTLAFLLLAGAALLGCKPELGAPVSLIAGPAILAVRGDPAEAAPGDQVAYEVLAVDTTGRVPAVDNAISRPVLWAVCSTPKPPIETNAVSRACLDGVAFPGLLGDSLDTYTAPMPGDACTLFGPVTPTVKAGEPSIRPRDPDVTGGYYFPVRVSMWIPEDLRRSGMAGTDTLVSFGLERISCSLANAGTKVTLEFNKTYTLNLNPHLAGVNLIDDAAGATVALMPGVVSHVGQGRMVTLEASWTGDSPESYPVFDVQSHTLITHREAMVVSWYATEGSFEHDSTGRSGDETELVTDNHWTAGSAGRVHLWVVLRDERGGTDFVGYDLDVDP